MFLPFGPPDAHMFAQSRSTLMIKEAWTLHRSTPTFEIPEVTSLMSVKNTCNFVKII